MNKEEFQKNRQIIRMIFTDMFNQMNNMYDQLAVSEKKIEKARLEGFETGVQENLEDCFDNYLQCDKSFLSESGLAMREKFEEALEYVAMKKNWKSDSIPIKWLIDYKDRFAKTCSKNYDAVAAEVLVDLLEDWKEAKPETGRKVKCVMCPKCKYFSTHYWVQNAPQFTTTSKETIVAYVCKKGHQAFPTIGCSDGEEKE